MKRNSFTPEQQENICVLYNKENLSLEKIAEMFSCSISPIIRVLKNNSIDRRVHTRSLFDIDYFSNINSEEKAYFLGLLMADGCNYEKGFTLSLQEEDYLIIEKFKKSIKFTGKINYRKHSNPKYKNIVRIKIHSEEISKQLSKLGVVPRKSLIASYPLIEEKYDSHFIRGYFDGDGCISTYLEKNKYSTCCFSVLGAYEIINKVSEKIAINCNIPISKLRSKKGGNKNTVHLSYGGRKRVKKVLEWLYKDSNDIHIDRKFLKFKQIQSWNTK